MLFSISAAAIYVFLKVWYAKTDVRTRFLALRAEHRPLDPDNKVGGGSKLGMYIDNQISLKSQQLINKLRYARATQKRAYNDC